MPSTIADCPHCGGANMGFNFIAENQIGSPGNQRWISFFACNKCQGGILIEYRRVVNAGHSDVSTVPADPVDFGFAVMKRYPEAMPIKIPAHIPTPLER